MANSGNGAWDWSGDDEEEEEECKNKKTANLKLGSFTGGCVVSPTIVSTVINKINIFTKNLYTKK